MPTFFPPEADAPVEEVDRLRSELRSTALSIRFKPNRIASLQAPISGFGTSGDGQSIDVVDQRKLKELAAALKADDLHSDLRRSPRG